MSSAPPDPFSVLPRTCCLHREVMQGSNLLCYLEDTDAFEVSPAAELHRVRGQSEWWVNA
jgi:hypothetical protein